MIKSNRIYIPIPKMRNTQVKVEIGGVDVTSRVITSSWIKLVTRGIGNFSLVLSNAMGQFSGSYSDGDVVKFYADNTDATTLQFRGRIDFVKDDLGSQGQVLSIEGRHRSFLLNEFAICHSASNTATSEILKDIIDKLPSASGFTYTNVQDDTTTMSVEWNYKPFWDCVLELANKGGFDCYVDDDLDVHYFEENSIANSSDAISEGDNFIQARDSGTDNYYEKTRVITTGQDLKGLPIIYTAISSNEGDDIREVFIQDSSANTYEKVQDIANAKLTELTDRNPQSRVNSFGLETVKPGDNIWIIIPRQKIAGQFKLIEINHKFGMKIGGWRTEVLTEELDEGVSGAIQKIDKTTQQIRSTRNVNKLNYSYNFNYGTNVGSHSNTVITILGENEGFLKTDGSSSGTWISPIRTLGTNPTAFELRSSGVELNNILIYISIDGGTVWTRISQLNQDKTITVTGKDLRIRVDFNTATAQLDSLALLYS